jgi:hypothetical protein
MPDSLLGAQYVEFVARGLDELQAKTDAYRKKLEDSTKAADGLNKAINSMPNQAQARSVENLNKLQPGLGDAYGNKLQAQAAQNQPLARLGGSSQAAEMQGTVAALNDLKKGMGDAYESNQKLKASLSSGEYAKAAQMSKSIAGETERLGQASKKIDLETQFGKAGAAMHMANEKLGVMKDGMSRIAGPAAAGFAILTGAVMGFVRAGLAGTVEGDRLQLRFQMLSREIAGVFMPVITAVTDKLTQAVQWFKHLTGENQNLIMRIVLGTAAALAFAMVLPKIVGGVQLVIVAFKFLSVAIGALGTEAGIASGGILPLLGILITGAVALTAFLFSTKAGAGALHQLEAAGKRIADAVMPALNRLMAALGDTMSNLAESVLPVFVTVFEAIAEAIIGAANAVDFLLKKYAELPGWARTLVNIISPITMLLGDQKKLTSGDTKQRQTPTLTGGGFEDFLASYKRIATASASGVNPQEQIVKNTQATVQKLDDAEKKRQEDNIKFYELLFPVLFLLRKLAGEH